MRSSILPYSLDNPFFPCSPSEPITCNMTEDGVSTFKGPMEIQIKKIENDTRLALNQINSENIEEL
jgi:hypothetical protein